MSEPGIPVNVFGYFLMAGGLLNVYGAYRDWDYFVATGNRGARLVHDLLGRRGARIIQMAGGTFFAMIGAYAAAYL